MPTARTRVVAALLVVGTAVGAAACSSDDGKKSGSTPSASAPSAPQTAGTAASAPSGPTVGQPFDLTTANSAGPATFRIVVAEVQANTTPDPAIVPQYRTAEPTLPPGQQWVIAKFFATNTGRSRTFWQTSNITLNVGADRFAPTPEALQVAQDYNNSLTESGVPTTAFDGVEPGVTGTVYGAWQIPLGAKPTSMTIPETMIAANVPTTPAVTVAIP
ncbi:hypothetical protein GCM10023205_25580 [Yinghuangia aomiensis]|uniref:DUF4352 domain-containing protein n=1 Tax=Yinghuangia aomiensis TaxID=676205 RepID=A0ABP9H341_9ACTN